MPSPMLMQEFFRVGIFTSTHGIKGEINVYPTTSDVSRFDYIKDVILDTKTGPLNLEVTGVKYFKGTPILKFKGIDNINDIEKYKGCDILVSRENAIPLGENEHYVADLLGLNIIDEHDKLLGKLDDVMQTGANDVYVVSRENMSDLLIPVIDDCVLDIKPEEGYIRVHLLEGLTDL